MPKFLMLGKYSNEAVKGITSQRTKQATEIIEKEGGKVLSMYALLGNYDLAFVLDLPSIQAAMRVSVKISKLTGIGFTTSPAVEVDEFDILLES